jgi:peptidoglycan/xylan/chitin deacetylase (PgdA/CDA1 family)
MDRKVIKKHIRYALSVSWSPLFHMASGFLRYPPGTFRILSLHHVPTTERPSFERLLEYLVHHHGLITPTEAEERLQGSTFARQDGKVPYLLTFDDGFKSHSDVVAPVLDDFGAKGVFFICPQLLSVEKTREQRALVRRYVQHDARDPHSLLMSWDDVTLLRSKGHTIGSHTLSHRRISSLCESEKLREIGSAAEVIGKVLGEDPKWFSYPFGDNGSIDSESYRFLVERYKFCCNTLRGVNTTKTSPLTLSRETIDLRTPWHYQTMVLAGGLDWLYLSKIKQLEQIAFKSQPFVA